MKKELVFSLFFTCFVFFGDSIVFGDSSTLDVLPVQTPNETLQLVRIFSLDPPKSNAFLIGLERNDATSPWRVGFPVVPVKVGRDGLAAPGMMSEQVVQTPQGPFAIGYLFGIAQEAPEGVRLPYRQATTSDFWIDDPNDPRYNCWVSGSEPETSHERLVISDPRYDLVLILRYNVDPPTRGKGSAIFFHVWKDGSTPTAGCVATSAENVTSLLRWLDPQKKPRFHIESGRPAKVPETSN